jgi:hypothetical protein
MYKLSKVSGHGLLPSDFCDYLSGAKSALYFKMYFQQLARFIREFIWYILQVYIFWSFNQRVSWDGLSFVISGIQIPFVAVRKDVGS